MPRNEIEKQFQSIQQVSVSAFKSGQKDILDRILKIEKQWELGKYSNEEFRNILKDYYREIYGHTTKN